MSRLLPILIILAAAIHFYRSPERAAELEVVPDSVEYAVAGQQFATTGMYEIQVNGRALPPRYPPGFSILFLAPIYRVAPGEIGNGIYAVWIMAVLMSLFSYLLGSKLAGPLGGVLAAILLLHYPQIALYTQIIMTDIPAEALGLAACWLYLRVREQPSAWLYLVAGSVVAISVAIRPLSGILLFPFLLLFLRVSRKPSNSQALSTPEQSGAGGRGTRASCSAAPPRIFGALPGSGAARRNGLQETTSTCAALPRRGQKTRIWVNLLLLLSPVATVILATAIYQRISLGDWHRTGYQLWLPVPYDYFHLVFSTRYIRDNVTIFHWNLMYLPIIGGAIGALALLSKRAAHVQPLIAFLLLGAAPISAIHLFYFFTDIRFHFLTLALLCILAGSGAATLIPIKMRERLWVVLPVLILTILLPRLAPYPLEDAAPIRNRVATAASRLLPMNAIFISAIDSAYLEHRIARGTSRRILPIDRDTPYARAWLAWRRIDRLDPPPRNAADHAWAGLARGGAERLYTFTADEEIATLTQWIDAGVPIYMDLLSSDANRPSRIKLEKAFALSPFSQQTPWLVRLNTVTSREKGNE